MGINIGLKNIKAEDDLRYKKSTAFNVIFTYVIVFHVKLYATDVTLSKV